MGIASKLIFVTILLCANISSCLGNGDDWNLEWKQNILQKLESNYGSSSSTTDYDKFTKVTFFLAKSDQEGMLKSGDAYISPYWQMLRYADDHSFKIHVDRLVQDILISEDDPEYILTMGMIYENLSGLKTNLEVVPEEQKGTQTELAVGYSKQLKKTWELLPHETRQKLLKYTKELLTTNRQVRDIYDNALSLVMKTEGNIIAYGLATLSIGWEAYQNILRWWNGEISGARCAKNIIDSAIRVGGGVSGGFGGMAIGSYIFPGPGTVIGAFVGGYFGSLFAQNVIEKITTAVFDLPKSEALENAYDFLGVHHTASVDELNKVFREKALRYHPDKGGREENFYKLQFHFGVIKASKGDHS